MQSHQHKAKEFAWYASHLDPKELTVYLSTLEAAMFEMTE
jgi:hypothetical protein